MLYTSKSEVREQLKRLERTFDQELAKYLSETTFNRKLMKPRMEELRNKILEYRAFLSSQSEGSKGTSLC